MWLPDLPPFIPFLTIALLVLFCRGRLVAVLMLVSPIWGALNLWQLDQHWAYHLNYYQRKKQQGITEPQAADQQECDDVAP